MYRNQQYKWSDQLQPAAHLPCHGTSFFHDLKSQLSVIFIYWTHINI